MFCVCVRFFFCVSVPVSVSVSVPVSVSKGLSPQAGYMFLQSLEPTVQRKPPKAQERAWPGAVCTWDLFVVPKFFFFLVPTPPPPQRVVKTPLTAFGEGRGAEQPATLRVRFLVCLQARCSQM